MEGEKNFFNKWENFHQKKKKIVKKNEIKIDSSSITKITKYVPFGRAIKSRPARGET